MRKKGERQGLRGRRRMWAMTASEPWKEIQEPAYSTVGLFRQANTIEQHVPSDLKLSQEERVFMSPEQIHQYNSAALTISKLRREAATRKRDNRTWFKFLNKVQIRSLTPEQARRYKRDRMNASRHRRLARDASQRLRSSRSSPGAASDAGLADASSGTSSACNTSFHISKGSATDAPGTSKPDSPTHRASASDKADKEQENAPPVDDLPTAENWQNAFSGVDEYDEG